MEIEDAITKSQFNHWLRPVISDSEDRKFGGVLEY